MCNKCNSKVIPEDDPVISAGEKLGNITCMEDSIATALMQILVTNLERMEKSDIQVVHDLVEPLKQSLIISTTTTQLMRTMPPKYVKSLVPI